MRQAQAALIGVDTPFLIAHTVLEHPEHSQALAYCEQLLSEDKLLALCPTAIDEFLHVVTDPRRFEHPLTIPKAILIVRKWMQSQETTYLLPTDHSNRLHLDWMLQHRLGRKRINDTRIASIYYHHGARTILTSNIRDFSIFNAFRILNLSEFPG
jgi:predicted nucleic acid-binding protein